MYPFFLIASLVLAPAVSGAGAPQAVEPKPAVAQGARTDFYGDPLPPGAVARLGTLRDSIGETSGDIVASPDGKYVTATTHGGWQIPLRLWDVETGRVIKSLKELEPPAALSGVRRVAFSDDSKLLAAGDGVGTVRIGRIDSGRKILELVGPDSVACLAFLPDAKSLAVGYMNGAIWLYRLSTGERIRSLAMAPYYMLYADVFSPDGTTAVVRGLDSRFAVRDVLTGREIRRIGRRPVPPRRSLTLGGQPVGYSLGDVGLRAFSPDDKLLALGGPHGPAWIWDVASGRFVRRFRHPRLDPPRRRPDRFEIDIDDSLEFHMVFSPDGKLLAAMDTASSTCLFSVATGQPYRRFPHLNSDHGIAFTADGKRLISGGEYFQYWDIARCQEIRRFPTHDKIAAVAFGPGGKLIATADGVTVRLWEATTGRELRQFKGHQATVSALAIAPDGKVIVSEDDDATRILWDLSTGREVRRDGVPVPQGRIAEKESSVRSIAFAPDGKSYAAADARGACLWDAATGREILRFAGANKAVWSICFAPDGETLAGAYGHGAVLWEAATGRKKRTLDHLARVEAVAFAPGGKTLATGDARCLISLFDIETGKRLRQFGDTQIRSDELWIIASLVFLPDGKSLAVGGSDSVVRLWNIETGKLRRVLEGHTQSVYALAVSPDGQTLATSSNDSTTLIWDARKIAD